MAKAIRDYPESNAVIVRRHGIYVWGATWQQAKSQAECIDYLCETAVEMKKIGVPISGGSTEVWKVKEILFIGLILFLDNKPAQI